MLNKTIKKTSTPTKVKGRLSQKVATVKKKRSAKLAANTYNQKPLPSLKALLIVSWKFFWIYRRPLLGVTAIYGLLYLVFVTGLSATSSLQETQETVNELFDNSLIRNVVLAGTIATTSGSGEESSQLYQTFLPVIGSLAMVWSIRELHANKRFKFRDAYYNGMHPLIPYLLVIFSIILKLLPMIIASYIFAVLQVSGLIASGIEMAVAVTLWVLLSAWSLYMVVPSILALYSVTLPGIPPMKAIKGSKAFVAGRRWRILARLFAAVLIGAIVALAIVLIFVAIMPALAVYVSLILGFLGLLFFHVFAYELYRSML